MELRTISKNTFMTVGKLCFNSILTQIYLRVFFPNNTWQWRISCCGGGDANSLSGCKPIEFANVFSTCTPCNDERGRPKGPAELSSKLGKHVIFKKKIKKRIKICIKLHQKGIREPRIKVNYSKMFIFEMFVDTFPSANKTFF